MNIIKIAGISALLLTTACATVTRGTTEQIVINYSPEDARVVTSLNQTCNQSPCTIEVSRKKEFSVIATKPGYEKQVVQVKTKIAGKGAAGLAGNILVGGVIGAGVDVATGAAKDHYPNPVNIELRPEGAPAPTDQLAPASGKKKDTPIS